MDRLKNDNSSGQALLLVLLAMATLATVVLSIVSRSVTEVGTSSREEESLRAFSAAEAGVEEALVKATLPSPPNTVSETLTAPSGGTPQEVSNYVADISGFPDNAFEFVYPFELVSGQGASVWLVTREGNSMPGCDGTHPCFQGDSIELCWGDPSLSSGDPQNPAIEVTIAYISGGEYTTARAAFDPVGGIKRRTSNNFTNPTNGCNGSDGIAGQNFANSTTIDFSSLGVPTNIPGNDPTKLMRVKMLYNDSIAQKFGVKSTNAFPAQGTKVSSQGTSGDSTRKIDAYLLNSDIPSIFDTVLFTPGDITK